MLREVGRHPPALGRKMVQNDPKSSIVPLPQPTGPAGDLYTSEAFLVGVTRIFSRTQG
jgi:hypothetical protein